MEFFKNLTSPVWLHSRSVAGLLLSGALESRDLPALAQEHGFAGIEWLDRLLPSYEPVYWQELGAAQKKAGFSSGALSLSLDLSLTPTQLAKQLDHLKLILSQVPLLQIKIVRIALASNHSLATRLLSLLEAIYSEDTKRKRPLGLPGRKLMAFMVGHPGLVQKLRNQMTLPHKADSMALQRAAWALSPLCRQAGNLGLTMTLENHWGLTSHPEDLSSLIDLVAQTGQASRWNDPVSLGVCLDLGNFYHNQNRQDALKLWDAAIKHVHFKSRQLKPASYLQEENYPDLLKLLKAIGYDGAFAIEYEGPGDGLEGAVNAAQWLREYQSAIN